MGKTPNIWGALTPLNVSNRLTVQQKTPKAEATVRAQYAAELSVVVDKRFSAWGGVLESPL